MYERISCACNISFVFCRSILVRFVAQVTMRPRDLTVLDLGHSGSCCCVLGLWTRIGREEDDRLHGRMVNLNLHFPWAADFVFLRKKAKKETTKLAVCGILNKNICCESLENACVLPLLPKLLPIDIC